MFSTVLWIRSIIAISLTLSTAFFLAAFITVYDCTVYCLMYTTVLQTTLLILIQWISDAALTVTGTMIHYIVCIYRLMPSTVHSDSINAVVSSPVTATSLTSDRLDYPGQSHINTMIGTISLIVSAVSIQSALYITAWTVTVLRYTTSLNQTVII